MAKVKKSTTLIKVIIAGIILLVTWLLVTNLTYIKNLLTTQNLQLTHSYSDGWYGFSFKYPDGYIIEFEGAPPTYGEHIYIRDPKNKVSCSLELYMRGTSMDEYIDTVKNGSPDSVVTYNSLTWDKRRIQSNQAFYGFDSTIWTTESHGMFIKFMAGKHDQEAYCEKILSTFTLSVDRSVKSAATAEDLRKMAIDYIASEYPEKRFLKGSYIYDDGGQRSSLDIYSIPNEAFVQASKSYMDKYPDFIYIKFVNNSGKWEIVSANSTPLRSSKQSNVY